MDNNPLGDLLLAALAITATAISCANSPQDSPSDLRSDREIQQSSRYACVGTPYLAVQAEHCWAGKLKRSLIKNLNLTV